MIVFTNISNAGSKSDLVCEALYGGKKYATKSVKDDNAPYWDEAFRVYVYSCPFSPLLLPLTPSSFHPHS